MTTFLRVCRARLRCPSWSPAPPAQPRPLRGEPGYRPPQRGPPRRGLRPRITDACEELQRPAAERTGVDADSHPTVTAGLPGSLSGGAPSRSRARRPQAAPEGGGPADPRPLGGSELRLTGCPGRRGPPPLRAAGLGSAFRSAPLRSPHGGPARPPLRGGGGGGGGRACRHFRGGAPSRKEARRSVGRGGAGPGTRGSLRGSFRAPRGAPSRPIPRLPSDTPRQPPTAPVLPQTQAAAVGARGALVLAAAEREIATAI